MNMQHFENYFCKTASSFVVQPSSSDGVGNDGYSIPGETPSKRNTRQRESRLVHPAVLP